VAEYNAEILKYLMLSAHYRSVLDFSPVQIEHVISGLARIYSALALADRVQGQVPGGKVPEAFSKVLSEAKLGVEKSLDDDFNTPEALARLFEVIRSFNNAVRTPGAATAEKSAISAAFLHWTQWLGGLMSLFSEPPAVFLHTLDDMLLKKKNLSRAEIDGKVQARSAARASKDFKKSDELRAELQGLGILVQDGPQGSEWEVAK
jgi:cysteinyl-tRNA synthetase